MLLLKKKKYAAVKIEEKPTGEVVAKRETKGLDMVRRDWCLLSKEVSRYAAISFSLAAALAALRACGQVCVGCRALTVSAWVSLFAGWCG